MIGISACLGGIACRYDGKSQTQEALLRLVEEKKAVLICPEVLGGLPIPREPAEIFQGDGLDVWQNKAQVIDNKGQDVTDVFKEGAKKAYQKLAAQGIDRVIMKENSPSCGSIHIYDGSFSGIKKNGVGVATAYFQLKGIKVYNEKDWPQALFN